jgi:demethylmenaquinone methyltransferase/2-methoxy-6-polyprenyl-1,4-benzoquinol methylase
MANYYDGIAKGYDELHAEEQLTKLEFIGKEVRSSPELKDFIKPSYKLLDVGCGTGISSGFFKVSERIGVDPSKSLIRIARVNYPTITFNVGSAEQLLYKDKQFDIIISLTAIQNFDNLEKGLNEIRRVGKHYILTFLKKSPKRDTIEELIQKKFNVIKKIEEDKDLIYFCK